MNKTVSQLLDDLVSGDATLDAVAKDFATRTWSEMPVRSEAQVYGVVDDDAEDLTSWEVVNSDSRLTADQYQTLAYAYQQSQDITAAAVNHTGAMIALIPSATDLERLAVDGGEPVEELHVTLGYLGEAAMIPDEVQQAVVQSVAHCVADRVSIVGNAFAVAMFNPETDDSSVTAAFNPQQKRDNAGRWTRDGDGVSKRVHDPRQLAMHYYAGAGFRKLNNALRGDGDLSKVPSRPVFLDIDGKFVDVEVSPQFAVENLDAAIADSPLSSAQTYYRGTTLAPPSIGTVLKDPGYLSTSREENAARSFQGGNGALWEITAPAGAHALDVDEGPNKHEKETIFPRSSAVRVRELVRDDTGRVVRVLADLIEGVPEDLTAAASGREPCVVLLLSGQQLAPFQRYVMNSVGMMFTAAGMEMHPQHSPWVAHLTLAYTSDADLSYFTDLVGPITFDRVRVAFGGTVVDLPLGGGPGSSYEEG